MFAVAVFFCLFEYKTNHNVSLLGKWLQKSDLKKLREQSAHTAKVVQKNWADVNTVGIVYDASDAGITGLVTEFCEFIRREHKSVHVLGYVDTTDVKKIPASSDDIAYFSKKDKVSGGLPDTAPVRRFVETPFDLLVDLNVENKPLPASVAVVSAACFKTGAQLQENQHLQLTFQLHSPLPQQQVEELITLIKQYLPAIRC